MAAKSAQKREESNARSALIWGSLAFCSILAVCTMIALRIGTTGGTLVTAKISKTPPPQKVVVQKPAGASEFEVARLKDAMRDLAAERDRLTARVATLEQSVGDITASITKKKEEVAPPPVAEKPKEPEPKPVEQASAPPPPPPAAPPVVAATPPPPVTTPAPVVAAKEAPEPAEKAQEKLQEKRTMVRSERMPERIERAQERAPERAERAEAPNFFGWFERPSPPPPVRQHTVRSQAHRRAAKITPPSPPPIPPARPEIAAHKGPGTQVAQILRSSQHGPDVTGATRTEFGVDLGGETSLDGLRARWTALRGHHRDTLHGMQPLVRVREGSRPGTVELHLIAGPFANAGSAARVCAKLQATGVACKAAEFDGQKLSVR